MKTRIYATYDKLACELNSKTFNAPNDDVAINTVENGLFDKDGKLDATMVRNAKNYKLVHLGEYDTESGVFGLGNDFRTVVEMQELIDKHTGKTE